MLARVLDKYDQCQRRNIPTATAFLSEAEQAAVQRLLNAAGIHSGYVWNGGYEGAGRKLLQFLPDWAEEDATAIGYLRAAYRGDGKPTHRHTNAAQVESHLRDGWKFQSRQLVREFGQPFRSREECVEYLRTFGADAESPKSTIHQLVETGDPVYPLYLPYEKKMRLYIIER